MRRRTVHVATLALLALLAIPLVGGFGPSRHDVWVSAVMDGRATDAQLKVLQSGQVVALEYTGAPGLARLALPPGRYTLVIDHGGDFVGAVVERPITVSGALKLDVELERRYEPNDWGYYSADTHAHTRFSPDGDTPVERAVGVQLAADLDLVFVSDHNTTQGHRWFAERAAARGVPFMLSEEVTTSWGPVDMGHFNVYPLNPGEPVRWQLPPAEIFREARERGARAVQVNHPKAGPTDYFNRLHDPRFDPNFDAAEVYNGEFSPDDRETVNQMFAFWNEGRRYAAVAVSDDHRWKDLRVEYGRPRTYVFLQGKLTAEAWLAGLLGGHAFVSYGPLIRLVANAGYIPGETVPLSSGEELLLLARVYSTTPLAWAQLIRDGEVIREVQLQGHEETLTFREDPQANGWYALRVLAQDGDRALTNPIWVEYR